MTVVEAYCDGSGTYVDDARGAPACIGVVVFEDGVPVVEMSKCISPNGSNNLAELRALRRAMVLLDRMYGHDVAATIYSDSQFAIGTTLNPWRINVSALEELILTVRAQYACFSQLRILHVKGHAGTYGNELADWLAGAARHRWFTKRDGHARKVLRARPNVERFDRSLV